MIFRNITYVALTNNMVDTCVRLASRLGLCQAYIARTVLDHRDYKRIEAASAGESRDKLNKSNGGSGI